MRRIKKLHFGLSTQLKIIAKGGYKNIAVAALGSLRRGRKFGSQQGWNLRPAD
jgi:hypothetical protein